MVKGGKKIYIYIYIYTVIRYIYTIVKVNIYCSKGKYIYRERESNKGTYIQ